MLSFCRYFGPRIYIDDTFAWTLLGVQNSGLRDGVEELALISTAASQRLLNDSLSVARNPKPPNP